MNRSPKRGGARPEAGRPKGSRNTTSRVSSAKTAFRSRCDEILEQPVPARGGGEAALFLETVKTLLHPIIEPRYSSAGEPIAGTEYLVNERTILGTLQFLVEQAHGKPPRGLEITSPDGSLSGGGFKDELGKLLRACGKDQIERLLNG